MTKQYKLDMLWQFSMPKLALLHREDIYRHSFKFGLAPGFADDCIGLSLSAGRFISPKVTCLQFSR
jgi:hypothetical protein